jgi:hypothetical protein
MCERILGDESMRALIQIFFVAVVAILAQGCLTVSEESISVNAETGVVEQNYYDIRSRKGLQEKDYSPEKDWQALKEAIAEESTLDKDVVKAISKGLFEEKKTLCASVKMQIKCPKCFPDKAALLGFVHEDKDWRFEVINGELFLFVPAGRKIVSTNGKAVETKANSLIVWGADATEFEYRVTGKSPGGTSLLQYFRQENQKAGGQAFP